MTHSPSHTYTTAFLIILIIAVQKGTAAYISTSNAESTHRRPFTVSSSALVTEFFKSLPIFQEKYGVTFKFAFL